MPSCISQKSPYAPANSALSAAGSAFGCTWVNGKCRKTNRSLRPKCLNTSFTIGCAAPQPGHSKSPYSTRVTGAFAGPWIWSCCVTGTFNVPIGNSLFRQSFQCVQDTVGAGIDRDWRAIAPEDHALAIDNEQRTFADALRFPVRAILLSRRTFRMEIGQEREVQSAILGKGLVTPGPINRNAETPGAVFMKFRQHLVVERHLVAAHRAPIGRVKRQHDGSAGEIAQRQILVGCDTKRKAGSHRTGRQYFRHSWSPSLLRTSDVAARREVADYEAASSTALMAVKIKLFLRPLNQCARAELG